MKRSKFIKQPNGTHVKEIVLPDETRIKIIIPDEKWSHACSRSVGYWIRQAMNGNIRPFRFGRIIRILDPPVIREDSHEDGHSVNLEYTPSLREAGSDECVITQEDDKSPPYSSMEKSKIYTCDKCKKIFRTTGGLSKHRRKCSTTTTIDTLEEMTSDQVSSSLIGNIREHGPVISVTDSQNVTVNIQNNITLREFGKENPRWLTSSFLYNVIQDIPRAIPRLLEQKHFNDEFPENKNLRIDTRRSIDKRLQVYETGRWKIKDSKQTFYRVLLEIYDILCDALENDLEDSLPDPDDDRTPEEQSHITNEIKKLKTNQRFIQKLERIRPVWDDFREKINDHDHRNELWEDLKTLLLDRHLAIEQGFE